MNTPLAYDTETTGLRRHDGAEMFAFSTCDCEGNTSVFRLDRPRTRRAAEARARLDDLWGPPGRRVAKVMHNARFDLGMTEKRLGRSLRGHEIHETMALSHIMQNQLPSHKLEDLGWELFGYDRRFDSPAHMYLNSERGMLDCPENVLAPYQAADAERTMLLFLFFIPKIKEEGLEEVYGTERRLAWTTLAMEDRGVMINRERCRAMIDYYMGAAEAARKRFQAIAGYGVNPASHEQLSYVLYKKMGLPVLKLTEKAKKPSTDAETLEALMEMTSHPIFDAIMQYNSYSHGAKILAGYLDQSDDDGVIHPSIHPYAARTGRQSCSRPNLQNVSKETTRKVRYPIPARKVFRPRPGYVNFHLDYSGIEARLLVNSSHDDEMTRILADGDGDIHSAAASMFYGETFDVAMGAARKSLRDAAKNGVFCIGYGGGVSKLAATLSVDPAEAASAHARFKARFPKFANLNRTQARRVREDGFVKTTFGRRLHLSKPFAGTNYDIQGTAAGILKRAQNRVDEYFGVTEEGMILTIHDEMVIQWPRKRLKKANGMLRDVVGMMTDFPQIDVPLEVEIKISTSDWNSARRYDL